jgi:hypothetical protein
MTIIIPSKSRSFTPSIVVSTPSWITASQFTDDNLAYGMESYSHTIAATGGYDSASLSAKMRIREAGRWFTKALGRDFAYYSPQGLKRWHGFINSITVNIGPLSYTIGPVIDIANRSQVLYSTKQYDTNPPIGGQETATAVSNVTASQARYGIFQTTLNGGSGTAAQMDEILAVFLAENSEPFRDTAASFSADGEAQISLEMLGYHHLLKRYPYSATTVGTQNASAKISAVLAADPSSRFSSSSLFIEANTTQVPIAEPDKPYAWDVIQNTIAVGDGSGNRMLFGIYNDLVAHYESLPTTVTRQMLLSDPAQRVESISGALIYPWDMRPGVWVAVQDFIIGAQQASDLKSDFRNIMVETVSYTAPFGLSINGKKVETLPQILARYGISGI